MCAYTHVLGSFIEPIRNHSLEAICSFKEDLNNAANMMNFLVKYWKVKITISYNERSKRIYLGSQIRQCCLSLHPMKHRLSTLT